MRDVCCKAWKEARDGYLPTAVQTSPGKDVQYGAPRRVERVLGAWVSLYSSLGCLAYLPR